MHGDPRGGAPVLALETATGGASVALVQGERVLAELVLAPERALSEQLLPAIDAVLGLAGVALDALGGLAIAIGPGSFTGLRVGLATLKGLAFGTELSVAAVSTLSALAHGARPHDGPVAAVIDARRDEVYAAIHPSSDRLDATLLSESLYAIDEVAAVLPPGVLLVGDAAARCAARATHVPGLRVADAALAQGRAASVGRLAVVMLANGQGVDAAGLAPRYLRRAAAEARRLGSPLEG